MASHFLPKSARHLLRWAALLLAFGPLWAFAQMNTSQDSSPGGSSWMPYNRYWGFNLGAPDYDKDCTPGFTCDDPDVGGKIYVGGQFNKWLGIEAGYVNFGAMDRNGGETKAQGINASLVGSLPLAEAFRVFGKVGTTYGWTKASGTVGPTGNDDGFGLSFGAGLGYEFNKTTEMIVEWDKHDFNFEGGDADVVMYSVGLKFRF